MKKNLIPPTQMLQYFIDEMEQHNSDLKNDFAHNFFSYALLGNNAISVNIKQKKYKIVYLDRECIFTIHINDEEIAAIEGIEDVVLFLIALKPS
jgi:hypothetical protein